MTVLRNPTRNKTLYTQIVCAAARFYCTSDKIRDKKKERGLYCQRGQTTDLQWNTQTSSNQGSADR